MKMGLHRGTANGGGAGLACFICTAIAASLRNAVPGLAVTFLTDKDFESIVKTWTPPPAKYTGYSPLSILNDEASAAAEALVTGWHPEGRLLINEPFYLGLPAPLYNQGTQHLQFKGHEMAPCGDKYIDIPFTADEAQKLFSSFDSEKFFEKKRETETELQKHRSLESLRNLPDDLLKRMATVAFGSVVQSTLREKLDSMKGGIFEVKNDQDKMTFEARPDVQNKKGLKQVARPFYGEVSEPSEGELMMAINEPIFPLLSGTSYFRFETTVPYTSRLEEELHRNERLKYIDNSFAATDGTHALLGQYETEFKSINDYIYRNAKLTARPRNGIGLNADYSWKHSRYSQEFDGIINDFNPRRLIASRDKGCTYYHHYGTTKESRMGDGQLLRFYTQELKYTERDVSVFAAGVYLRDESTAPHGKTPTDDETFCAGVKVYVYPFEGDRRNGGDVMRVVRHVYGKTSADESRGVVRIYDRGEEETFDFPFGPNVPKGFDEPLDLTDIAKLKLPHHILRELGYLRNLRSESLSAPDKKETDDEGDNRKAMVFGTAGILLLFVSAFAFFTAALKPSRVAKRKLQWNSGPSVARPLNEAKAASPSRSSESTMPTRNESSG